MFRLCTQKDYGILMEYLSQDSVLHTFIIADIKNYGFNQPYQQVYMDTNEDETCKAVALRYYNNLIISGFVRDMDFSALASLCTAEISNIMGEDCLLDSLSRYLPKHKHISKILFTMAVGTLPQPSPRAERATLADVDDIYNFLMSIDEIKHLYTEKQMIDNRIRHNEGAHFIIRENGAIVGHCNSAAGTQTTSMVGGLAVCPSLRHRGMGGELLATVCADLVAQKKIPCLFETKETKLLERGQFKPYRPWGHLLAP